MTLPAAKNAVAAMRDFAAVKVKEGRDTLAAIVTRWADAIEPALSLPDAGAVACRTYAPDTKTWGPWIIASEPWPESDNAYMFERGYKIEYAYSGPAPASAEVTEAYERGKLDGYNSALGIAPPVGLAQPASSRVPAGFVLVPVEPTEAMVEAAERMADELPLSDWGKIVQPTPEQIYAAMLAAAPADAEGK